MDSLLHLSSTNSTNDDAYGLALEGAEHGFAVLADTQFTGRGRLGRTWVSPAGTGLYCSIVLRPTLPCTEFPQITLTAGLALCSVIERLCKNNPFGLKWPNDLYCAGKKCGGILVESSPLQGEGNNVFVVVGIGVNVNTQPQSFPEELRGTATSLLIESGKKWDIQELFLKIHASLLRHVAIHEQQGFSAILKEWRKRDVLLGEEVQWLTYEKKVVTATGLGPDNNGQLLARDREGKVHAILSGDVRLAGREIKNRQGK